jgi:enoyl-CoA hydratase/carnithine racemase
MALVGRYERMSASRAFELGIVSEIVDPPDRLRARAQEVGESIAEGDAAILRARKEAMWVSLESEPIRASGEDRCPLNA